VNSDEPLVEVACCTGFADQACFNRAFLTLMGISPGRWRRAFEQPGTRTITIHIIAIRTSLEQRPGYFMINRADTETGSDLTRDRYHESMRRTHYLISLLHPIRTTIRILLGRHEVTLSAAAYVPRNGREWQLRPFFPRRLCDATVSPI